MDGRPYPATAAPIVIGLDDSAGAHATLAWAATESERQHRPLLIVHVSPAAANGADPNLTSSPVALKTVESLLSAAAHAVATSNPSIEIWTRVAYGNPVDELIKLSADAEMIVVGIRGDDHDGSGLLGPTAQRIAVHAACPVAVLPAAPSPSSPSLRVVVGLTVTPEGRAALVLAFEQARLRRARLVCIRAWGGRGGADDVAGGADELLLGDLASLRERYADVAVEQVLVPDEPAVALLEAAAGAQLLVLGCLHSDEHWSTRLGPVPVELLHRVTGPLILVGPRRAQDRDIGGGQTLPLRPPRLRPPRLRPWQRATAG